MKKGERGGIGRHCHIAARFDEPMMARTVAHNSHPDDPL
jgi:hypothetical protein